MFSSSNTQIYCPACKTTEIKLLGSIPPAEIFAGRQLPMTMEGGQLYECTSCHLQFRFPIPDQSMISQLYQNADVMHWEYKEAARPDWELAIEWLAKLPGGKILDVGCWNGNFLSRVHPAWEKYGIELNDEAAQVARSAGIKIIGANASVASETHHDFFDVVTAFDILEHLENPDAFLIQLLHYIRPGGHIVIGTGNSQTWTWQLAISRYWYCWHPEHLSFINPAWVEYEAKKHSLDVIQIQGFSHAGNPSAVRLALQTFANLTFLYLPGLFTLFRQARWRLLGTTGRKVVNHPPVWDNASDHILVVLQKMPV
jgi:2-polyprenyl-3-methyl-5-hydroxy-6-metoxy-1,4-benzoquinol methylase